MPCWKTVLETLPGATLLTDRDGRLVAANPLARALLGDNLVGKLLNTWVTPLSPADESAEASFEAVLTRPGAGRIFLRVRARRVSPQRRLVLLEPQVNGIGDSHPLGISIERAAFDLIYLFDLEERRCAYLHPADPLDLRESLHPDDRSLVLDAPGRWRHAGDDEVRETQVRLRDPEGGWRRMRVRETLFRRAADGRPTQILGMARDVTEAQRHAETLADALARQETLLEHTPAAVALADERERIVLANAAFCRLFQTDSASVVGLDSRQATDVLRARFASPGRACAEVRCLLSQRRPVIGQEVLLANGQALERDFIPILADGLYRGHLFLYRETAEFRRREAERNQALREAADARHLLRRLAEAAPVCLYLYDLAQQSAVHLNSALAHFLGRAPEEMQTLDAVDLAALMHPEECARYPAHLARLLAARDGETVEGEYRLRHRDGSWRWIRSREEVFERAGDGSPLRIVGIAQDVTAERQVPERTALWQKAA